MDKNRKKQCKTGFIHTAIMLAVCIFLYGCSSGWSEKPAEEIAERNARAFRERAGRNAREGTAGSKDKKVEEAESTKEHTLVGTMWMYYEDEEVPYVDGETFELIRKACQEIGYSTECRKGDPEVYEEYLQKFRRFVLNEVPFLDKRTDREIYLNDWKERGYFVLISPYVSCFYYFFDMNGDGLPELCIDGGYPYRRAAVFAYDTGTDQIILWALTKRRQGMIGTLTGAFYRPYGSSEVYEFFRLNPHGGIESEILFWAERADLYHYDINMVMFPDHAVRGGNREIPEEMKQQGIYEESSGQWFFRITDEQFEELKKPYAEALETAEENISREQRSYEELFGE